MSQSLRPGPVTEAPPPAVRASGRPAESRSCGVSMQPRGQPLWGEAPPSPCSWPCTRRPRGARRRDAAAGGGGLLSRGGSRVGEDRTWWEGGSQASLGGSRPRQRSDTLGAWRWARPRAQGRRLAQPQACQALRVHSGWGPPGTPELRALLGLRKEHGGRWGWSKGVREGGPARPQPHSSQRLPEGGPEAPEQRGKERRCCCQRGRKRQDLGAREAPELSRTVIAVTRTLVLQGK